MNNAMKMSATHIKFMRYICVWIFPHVVLHLIKTFLYAYTLFSCIHSLFFLFLSLPYKHRYFFCPPPTSTTKYHFRYQPNSNENTVLTIEKCNLFWYKTHNYATLHTSITAHRFTHHLHSYFVILLLFIHTNIAKHIETKHTK